MRHADPFHLSLLAGTAAVLVLSVALAALGVGIAICLVVLMFAPVVTVLGYETLGYRHVEEALARMRPARWGRAEPEAGQSSEPRGASQRLSNGRTSASVSKSAS